MITLSLDIRGLRGAPKQLALKKMFDEYKPNIVLFQEAMCLGSKTIEILSSILKNWKFYSIDANSLSMDLVIGWNSNFNAISHFLYPSIVLEGRDNELDKVFKVVNPYGPYGDKKPFWKLLKEQGILFDDNVIVGGHLRKFKVRWQDQSLVFIQLFVDIKLVMLSLFRWYLLGEIP